MRIAALVIALALAGCGGGAHGVPPAPAGVSGSASAGSRSVPYNDQLVHGATPVRRAQANVMSMHVVVHLHDGAGLGAYAQQVSDPQSGYYRQFLSAQQIGDRFGAAQSDYTSVAQYFQAYGLHVIGWPQRLSLRVSGSQANMERAFGTTFSYYTSKAGFGVVAPATKPQFSRPLPIDSVVHIVEGNPKYGRSFVPVQNPNGGGLYAGYSPQQIAAAFDYTGAYNAGYTGKGITIGVIGTGALQVTTNGRLGDADAFKALYHVGGTGTVTLGLVSPAAAAVGGGGPGEGSPPGTPPPVTPPCSGILPACNPEDVESQIDAEQSSSLAPDAHVIFYLAYVPDECQTPGPPTCSGGPNDLGAQQGLAEADDEIQQAIADNTADVVSISYSGGDEADQQYYTSTSGGPYNPQAFGPTEFAALAAEGIAAFAASGDAGAEGCARPYSPVYPSFTDQQCASYPAADPNVIAVGGVTATINSAGRFIGPITGWGLQTGAGFGASGGAIAHFLPRPAWQTGSGISGTTRNTPDLSLEADSLIDVAVLTYGDPHYWGPDAPFAVGGTSVATPEMAAMWALVLQACAATASCAKASGSHPYRLGNPGPLLYGIYNNPARYAATFYDVTFGNNGVTPCNIDPNNPNFPCPGASPDPGNSAGAGYDLITGIGVPFARALIRTVVGV